MPQRVVVGIVVLCVNGVCVERDESSFFSFLGGREKRIRWVGVRGRAGGAERFM